MMLLPLLLVLLATSAAASAEVTPLPAGGSTAAGPASAGATATGAAAATATTTAATATATATATTPATEEANNVNALELTDEKLPTAEEGEEKEELKDQPEEMLNEYLWPINAAQNLRTLSEIAEEAPPGVLYASVPAQGTFVAMFKSADVLPPRRHLRSARKLNS